MATLDYARRLQNMQDRKFDRELNESVFAKSASAKDLPENVKYLVEAMRPIDQKYNEKTFDAAGRVQKHLESKFNLHFNRTYRRQGSVCTGTNIKVHSDFDLLTIIEKYFYPEVLVGEPYTASVPDDDIQDLRAQSIKILNDIYDEVDASGAKSVAVYNKSLNRKIDVVFCFWYRSQKYQETKDEHYQAIYLYDFPQKKKMLDYPFATIANVNGKGNATRDGSRRGIRLLKTLRADREADIKVIKSFHLTSLVHVIPNDKLCYGPGAELGIAQAISSEIDALLADPVRRKGVKSPNGLENPFEKDETTSDLKLLKDDLDALIADSARELTTSLIVKRAVANYEDNIRMIL